MSFPSVHSDQQSTAFATIVSEALFPLCCGTYISTLLGCVRLSGHVPRLLLFSFFSKWILILLVQEKHRKTL